MRDSRMHNNAAFALAVGARCRLSGLPH